MIECVLLGVIESKQKEGDETIRNDRYIFKPVESIQYKTLVAIKDVEEKLIEQIEKFFEFYHQQEGDVYKSIGTSGPTKARRMIEAGLIAKVE